MTPLHISSHYGHGGIIKKLVASNINVNCEDNVSHLSDDTNVNSTVYNFKCYSTLIFNAVINNTNIAVYIASQWDEYSKKFHSQEWKILSVI